MTEVADAPNRGRRAGPSACCACGLAGRDPVTPAGAAAHPQAGTRSAGATMVRGRTTAEGKADTGRGAQWV